MTKIVFVNGANAKCGCRVDYSDGNGEYSNVIAVHLCKTHDKGKNDLYRAALQKVISILDPEWDEEDSEGILEDIDCAMYHLRDLLLLEKEQNHKGDDNPVLKHAVQDKYYTNYTRYTLSATNAEGKEEDIESSFEKITGFRLYLDLKESYKWPRCEKDMKKLSLRYPEIIFKLQSETEYSSELRVKYFLNGKQQTCNAVVTYENYNKNKFE